MNPVDVVGIGIVSSISSGVEETKTALSMGKSGIRQVEIPFLPESIPGIMAPVIGFDFKASLEALGWNRNDKFFSKALQAAARSHLRVQTAVVSCAQAIADAGVSIDEVDSQRFSVVVGGQNLGQASSLHLWQTQHNQLETTNPRYALQFMDTDHIGVLSSIFGIRGEGLTVGGASASGNVAIVKAKEILNKGDSDVCLVVGAMMELSGLELAAFYNVGAMAGRRFAHQPGQACRPFDQDHEGFIYGQASAAILLARPDWKPSLKRRARILGTSLILDGNHLSDPSKDGEVRAMSKALKDAGMQPENIDYVNSHGTASIVGDETESQAVLEVFHRSKKPWAINSSKSLFGHCLTSAGVVEAVASIIQMNEGFLHPNLNLDKPIAELPFVTKETQKGIWKTCLSNSFGFGGFNSSIVIESN